MPELRQRMEDPCMNEGDCTTIAVGRSASRDGCVLIGHNEDDSPYLGIRHQIVVAGEHPGAIRLSSGKGQLVYREPHTSLELSVPENSFAFDWTQMFGQDYGDAFVNTCGVAIYCDGASGTREQSPELVQGGIGHFLPQLLAEQAHSARDAVVLGGRLVEQYGYCDARIVTIADQQEVWLLQLPGGHQWLAQRVPDDMVAVLPNYLISRDIDLQDTDHYLASPDLVAHAIQRGWYDPAGGQPFDFRRSYGPPEINVSPLSTGRQQTGLFLLTGCEFPLDDMPFAVRPSHSIGLGDVTACLRCTVSHGSTEQEARSLPGSFHRNIRTTTPQRPISVWTTQESTVVQLHGEEGTIAWRASGIPDELPYTPWYPLAMIASGIDYPDPYGCVNPDHLDLNSAYWVFRLFATAVDMDYMHRFPELENKLFPVEQKAIAANRSLQEKLTAGDKDITPDLLATYGTALGMKTLTLCQQLLLEWQTRL